MKIIDSLTHYGIKLYSYVKELQLKDSNLEIEKIVLNPLYKYSCQCCVDGFYQQFLWSKGRDYAARLGIYNPNCRIPPQVEIQRQYEKEIHGIVLHPKHHNFSLLHERLSYVYEFAKDHDLPLIIHNPNYEEVKKILTEYRVKIAIVDKECPTNLDVYCITIKPTRKGIYGSGSPYNGKNLLESAREFVISYDPDFHYYNAKRFFKL